jgi:uncharacterized membrane protein YcaP (DUF421 family)
MFMSILPQVWEVLWKSMVVYFLLIVLTRLIGKKLLSQMTFFDFVVGITLGTIAGAFITIAIPGFWVLLSPVILTIAVILTGLATLNSIRLRKLIEGEPVVIIQNGKILEHNMRKLRYHLDDLEMQLRERDIFDFNQVEFAVLEPHGQLSVQKKSQYRPLTPSDVKAGTKYEGLATEIIKDGRVFEQNLAQNHLDFNWLYRELRRNNIADVREVLYANLNTGGTLYIDRYDDRMDYVQKVED